MTQLTMAEVMGLAPPRIPVDLRGYIPQPLPTNEAAILYCKLLHYYHRNPLRNEDTHIGNTLDAIMKFIGRTDQYVREQYLYRVRFCTGCGTCYKIDMLQARIPTLFTSECCHCVHNATEHLFRGTFNPVAIISMHYIPPSMRPIIDNYLYTNYAQ